jgi:hypothetical protein
VCLIVCARRQDVKTPKVRRSKRVCELATTYFDKIKWHVPPAIRSPVVPTMSHRNKGSIHNKKTGANSCYSIRDHQGA